MSTDERVLAFVGDDEARLRRIERSVDRYHRIGAWVSVERVLAGREWLEGDAAAVHLSIDGLVLHALLQTTSETIWFRAYKATGTVRELFYTGDCGWMVQDGEPFPEEDHVAVRALLVRDALSADSEGYELLSALVPGEAGEMREGHAVLPDGMPACTHGYFQSVLQLPSGRVFAGVERAPFGWSPTATLIDLDGKAGFCRNTRGDAIGGAAVGVTRSGLIATFADYGEAPRVLRRLFTLSQAALVCASR